MQQLYNFISSGITSIKLSKKTSEHLKFYFYFQCLFSEITKRGSCQICTRGQNCTKIKLYEETFARADNFTRRYF